MEGEGGRDTKAERQREMEAKGQVEGGEMDAIEQEEGGGQTGREGERQKRKENWFWEMYSLFKRCIETQRKTF